MVVKEKVVVAAAANRHRHGKGGQGGQGRKRLQRCGCNSAYLGTSAGVLKIAEVLTGLILIMISAYVLAKILRTTAAANKRPDIPSALSFRADDEDDGDDDEGGDDGDDDGGDDGDDDDEDNDDVVEDELAAKLIEAKPGKTILLQKWRNAFSLKNNELFKDPPDPSSEAPPADAAAPPLPEIPRILDGDIWESQLAIILGVTFFFVLIFTFFTMLNVLSCILSPVTSLYLATSLWEFLYFLAAAISFSVLFILNFIFAMKVDWELFQKLTSTEEAIIMSGLVLVLFLAGFYIASTHLARRAFFK